jgi:hypothetical protein
MEKIYIPRELLHIILEYDGKIKYRTGKYINIIKKNDFRYNIVENIISKKLLIIKNTKIDGSRFFFDVRLKTIKNRFLMIGICYDYHWHYHDKFEICFYHH